MKKRFWSLLLVFSMAFCLLLPVSASALARGRGEESFAYLKNCLLKNGNPYSGVEKVDDSTINITVDYDSGSDQLRFGVSQKQWNADYDTEITYIAELTVPSALEMPYDAAQHLSMNDFHAVNEGKIYSNFTTQSEVPLSGDDYGTEKLFSYAIALALRHAQDNLLYGSGYTIADLGFTALFEELYGDHTHEAITNNAAPATCTEAGFSGDKFCAVCGEPMGAGEVVPALGHKPVLQNAVAATCTKDGYSGDEVCTVCGETVKKGEVIKAAGHKIELENDKKATCTEAGYSGDEVCSVCGEVLQRGSVIPALEHQTELQNAVPATCTEAGYTGDEVCTLCGETMKQGSEIPALGHSWDAGVVTEEPTIEKDGVRTFTCTREGCGAQRTEPIPKLNCPHHYEDTVVSPTCTEEGWTLHKCSICGASYRDSFTAALGHKPELKNDKPATCTTDGYTGDEVCSVCGETVKKGEAIKALGHKPELINDKKATCTADGYTGDEVCSVCGETLKKGEVIKALGHKTELQNAVPATETAAGYTGDEVCTVCGEIVKKGEVIPKIAPKTCDGGKDCPSKIFTDVNQALWYHLPIDWAVTNKVTTGLTATTFGPNASCTRAQMVTFLWRAVGEPEPKSASNPFVDVPAGQYYAKAVLWALENGVTTGVDASHFAPGNTVTRAQTVTFLWRLKHEPAPTGSQSFPDVPAGQYYAKAVMWAVENNVTNGMGNGLFAPNDNCTRAQIVTFLYRAVHA